MKNVLPMKNVVHFCGIFTAALLLASCNVTRVITNESKYTTRGDTTVVITTKTVETYDASKKL